MNLVVNTPIKDNVLEEVKVGDIVYLNGVLVTARDAAHERLLKHGFKLPITLKFLPIFHAGPIVKKTNDSWSIVSIGPTTSMRMESLEYDFIERTGIKMIIGKGGMGSRTAEACKKFKAVHAIFPGGCAVVAAERVKRVLGVEWLDLGVPEALWILEVENFGPLIVSIDTNGNNMFDERIKSINSKKFDMLKNLDRELSSKL
ncbi:MAG: L(+)-tartrate dehydratase subunit beta [Nitrososphaeria archaeon]|nr:L(+)-tartrate dehydratase subunit beta [Nitrososphaeria archaeon]